MKFQHSCFVYVWSVTNRLQCPPSKCCHPSQTYNLRRTHHIWHIRFLVAKLKLKLYLTSGVTTHNNCCCCVVLSETDKARFDAFFRTSKRRGLCDTGLTISEIYMIYKADTKLLSKFSLMITVCIICCLLVFACFILVMGSNPLRTVVLVATVKDGFV